MELIELNSRITDVMNTLAQAISSRRTGFLGGSDANIIMGGDHVALLRLWRVKRGEIEPEDLSGNLIVQLGVVTEALNRRWFERNTGQALTDIQRRIRHLDPMVGGDPRRCR